MRTKKEFPKFPWRPDMTILKHQHGKFIRKSIAIWDNDGHYICDVTFLPGQKISEKRMYKIIDHLVDSANRLPDEF